MYSIEHYLSADGHKDLYMDWLQRLRDSQAKVTVVRRMARVELGNFGDQRMLDADIARAVGYSQDWLGRVNDEKQTPRRGHGRTSSR